MSPVKVLVLGNDPQINNIDFIRLQPNVVTLGVNRIWLKHIPNYFFFNDHVILDELMLEPEKLEQLKEKSTIFSSDWMTRGLRRKANYPVPSWVNVSPRPDFMKFPDSVTTAMEIFSRKYFGGQRCVFYIAGVSLIWQEPSHFWKDLNYSGKNSFGETWYSPRFKRIDKNFRTLKDKGHTMISVNPNSILNKTMRYESIDNLYQ